MSLCSLLWAAKGSSASKPGLPAFPLPPKAFAPTARSGTLPWQVLTLVLSVSMSASPLKVLFKLGRQLSQRRPPQLEIALPMSLSEFCRRLCIQ